MDRGGRAMRADRGVRRRRALFRVFHSQTEVPVSVSFSQAARRERSGRLAFSHLWWPTLVVR